MFSVLEVNGYYNIKDYIGQLKSMNNENIVEENHSSSKKRYLFYLCRWQLSTLVLAPVAILLASQNKWIQISAGNLIGGMIFYWIDKFIFNVKKEDSKVFDGHSNPPKPPIKK